MASLTTGGPEFLVPLREHTEKLHALLSDPHPGLVTGACSSVNSGKRSAIYITGFQNDRTGDPVGVASAGALAAAVLITGIARVLAAGWPR